MGEAEADLKPGECPGPQPKIEVGPQSRAARAGWVFMGSIALGIGVLGIPLPVLPTTPFLLAALYCYSRGSQRCHDWLRRNRLLSPFLVSGQAVMSTRMRLAMASFVWVACAFSLIVFAREPWQQVTVLAVGLGMTIYLALCGRGRKRTSAQRSK